MPHPYETATVVRPVSGRASGFLRENGLWWKILDARPIIANLGTGTTINDLYLMGKKKTLKNIFPSPKHCVVGKNWVN